MPAHMLCRPKALRRHMVPYKCKHCQGMTMIRVQERSQQGWVQFSAVLYSSVCCNEVESILPTGDGYMVYSAVQDENLVAQGHCPRQVYCHEAAALKECQAFDVGDRIGDGQ